MVNVDEAEPLIENTIIIDNNSNKEMISLPSIDAVLPNDCLHTIFDLLLLKDLQPFGRTCRRSRDAVNKYIYREYIANILEVKMIRGGVMFGPNTGGLFESVIAMIKIHTHNINAWTIIAKRFKKMNKVIFNKSSIPNTKITPEHGIVLRDILREAKSIEFKRNAFTDEHGQHTLSHCQKLKYLVIGKQIFTQSSQLSNAWMEKMYPTLEDVQFDFGFPNIVNYDQQGDKIRTFFIQNPTIKHLTIILNIEDSLNFIRKINIHLDKLSLRLTEKMNLKNVVDILNLLYARNQIKSYELILQDHGVLEKYADLINNINGLEMVYMKRCNYGFASNYPAFFNKLKVLHIGDISPDGAKLLASNAVHLKEIYIDRGSMEIVHTFVTRAANLKKIALNEVTESLDEFAWTKFIKGRAALTEPRQLYIYVPETTYVAIKWKEMPLTLGLTEAIPLFYLGLIEIKRVESLMPYRPC